MTDEDRALPSYLGYEYQLVVTAWLALDLIFERESCESIEVEPASQEDVLADLRVPRERLGDIETIVDVAFERGPVEIQIKHRSRFLSVAEFRSLLETPPRSGTRGPAPRERALTRLGANEALRYLVITDAEVHPDLKDFVVESVARSHRAAGTTLRWLTDDVAVRIGVREKRVSELVEYEIARILETFARVPFQNVPACRDALVERMRERLLGRRASSVGRQELKELIAKYGGFPPSLSDTFVPPARFDEFRKRLEQAPHALVLVGTPGIGKTQAAEQIALRHRHDERPFEILKDPRPHEIRAALSQPGRTVFYLEDPWGRYKLAEDAATWSDELARLIREAKGNPDKRFLVTSRTGLLRESIDLSPQGRDLSRVQRQLGALVVSIVEGDFDVRARRRILEQSIRGASRWQRDWVEDRVTEIVSNLTVPQALSVFAHAVRSATSSEGLTLDRMIADSQVTSIGDVVRQQVLHLNEVAAAVTLWIFLSVGEPLDDTDVQELALWLDEEISGSSNLLRLCEHMTANGWLSVREGVLNAHSTVLEGLERLVDEHRTESTRVLRALLAVLVRQGRVEMTTRLLSGLNGRNVPVPPEVRSAIDQHLLDAVLAAEATTLVPAIVSLARHSKGVDVVSQLARALGTRSETFGLDGWSKPSWSSAERASVMSSLDAERIVRCYVRTGVVRDATSFGEEDLVEFLWSLGWDLSEEFTDAALDALRRGQGIAGALHGALAAATPAWDRLIDATVAEYQIVDRWFQDEGVKQQSQALEGEFGAAYSAHIIDEPGERFYASTNAFEKIVAARRALHGYGWLVSHPHRALMVRAWAKSIPDEVAEAVHDELHALHAAAESWNLSDVWHAIGRSRCQSLTPVARHALQHGPIDNLTAVWGALFGCYDAESVAAAVAPMLASLGWCRRAAAIFEVRKARMPERHDSMFREVKFYRASVRDLLVATEGEALDACVHALAGRDELESDFGPGVLDLIESLVDGPHELLASGACLVLARHKRVPRSALPRLLSSDDEWVRLHTMRAVGETDPLERTPLLDALADRYYQCRRYAMFALSKDASPEERARIIEMTSDASAPVRAACARIIGERQWIDGVDALCSLLSDRRDLNESMLSPEIPDYHVARDAARALSRFPAPLPATVVAFLLQFLNGGHRACDDLVVHRELVRVVGRERDPGIAPLMAKLLRSGRRMGEEGKGSFPLRFAAAWSWLDHILEHPEDARLIARETVEAAEHTDGRLAAPALLAVGVGWRHMPDGLQHVLDSSGTSDERILLLELGSRVAGDAIPEDQLARRLPSSHPGRRLVAKCWESSISDDDFNALLDADAEVKRWLETIHTPSPVNAAIRASLIQCPREHFAGSLSNDGFREDELVSGIPILSSFDLAGLE